MSAFGNLCCRYRAILLVVLLVMNRLRSAAPLRSSSIHAVMRQSSLYHWCLSTVLFTSGAYGLPFRGRAIGKDDSTKEEAVVVDGGEIHIRHPQQQSSGENRRNAVVELFYADPKSASTDLKNEIQIQTSQMFDFLVQTRRTLHRNPELMYQEKETSQTIQTLLTEMGIAYTTGWAKNIHLHAFEGPGGYGIVADIGTGREPCVLLRADIDALPIDERTEHVEDFRSQNDNRMHACGHDGHTTMLLGAAKVLKQMEDSLPGTVRLIFQVGRVCARLTVFSAYFG